MATNPTTRLVSTHKEWVPHGYQKRGVSHLLERHSAALFLDPGLGKTSIVLEAFRILKASKQAYHMLVVAPLRVCQTVWRQEGQQWSQFRELTFSLIHGPKKIDRLRAPADIHLINPEGIPWLAQQYFGRSDLPWDVVTIDEITKFKNHGAMRSKKLRVKIQRARYRWGLTGSPAPNGYMDLFGQMLMLDDGAALGRFITHYRDKYFTLGFDGFTYNLRNGSAERIEARIAPYVLRMAAEDYLELPPLVTQFINVPMSDAVRAQYKELKKELILSLPEGVVTAANSGAVYSKLKQLTNGAVYKNVNHDYIEIHDAKLAALEELVEELAGQPLLVAYEFQSDLERIRKRLGESTPTLSGQTEKNVTEIVAAWNRGELPVLLVHPASAGHGLNLQGSGAAHICWFSRPWDLEMYDQTIRRIYRQGSTADRVINHVLHISGTMDDLVHEALSEKDVTQKRLLNALNATLTEEGDMALNKKLGFQGEQGGTAAAPPTPRGWGGGTAAAEPAPATTTAAPAPKGWNTAPPAPEPATPAPAEQPSPRGWGGAVASPETDPQRAAIAGKLAGEQDSEEEEAPASARAMGMFPPGMVQQLTEEDAPAQAVGNSATGAVVPPGWNAPAPVSDSVAPEKPARSRRKAADAVVPADTGEKGSAAILYGSSEQNQASRPDAEVGFTGYQYNEPVRIEFNGIPARAVAAALLAIASTLQER